MYLRGESPVAKRLSPVSHYVDFLRDRFDAYAVESEGGPVARIAYEFGVPVIAIRTLSDKANGRAHESYANFAQEAADNSARVVLTMLKRIARQKTGRLLD